MDFRLEVFAATASTLNFTKAAELLNISQPAVTKHIQELEKEYGIQLFARRGAKLELTYQGECFLVSAKDILKRYKNLRSDSEMLKTVFSGGIKIGAPAPLYYGIIPRLAADFCLLSPGVNMDLKIVESPDTHNAIRNGEIDVGFSYDSKNVKYPFIRDSFILVSAGHLDNLYNEANADDELENLRFVSYGGDAATDLQIKTMFSGQGLDYNKIKSIATLENSRAAVDFLIHCGKSGQNKIGNVCSILWKNQVAEYLKQGVLHESDCKRIHVEHTITERIYGIEGSNSQKNSRFMEYASMWGQRMFGAGYAE
ncbi:MAG TPA: LysR family transcriptional regulator [Candidatus Egerieousia sp.]|nr:LysR family transcriptional regulator [Candidatus Egerieousia sp.]